MVDFNNESTVGTPPGDLVKILILQARENTHEALEDYHKKIYNGTDASESVLRARLYTWWLKIKAMLKRRDSKLYDRIELLIKDDKYDSIINAIEEIEILLDELRLTKIDTRQSYDKTSWESENKQYGL